MPYRLSLEDPVPLTVRRCASEELERAAAGLHEPAGDPVAAVHGARKSVKKTRALLRLVAPGVPREDVRRLQRELRDAGRLLAGARDADVAVEVVTALAQRYAGRAPGTAFEALRARLAADAAAQRAEPEAVEAAAEALGSLAAGVDAWPLDGCDWEAVGEGAARTYARGRAALEPARSAGGTEELHDWRKRVKDLWYQQRLLEQLWPGVLRAHADETKRLSELLGDDHDAAALAARLRTDPALVDEPRGEAEAVAALADERRAELQREALLLGRRVFADRPKAFRRRLGVWLDVARDGAPA